MFIGLKKKIIYLFYIIFPFIYLVYINLLIILILLFINNPIFLKEHKEFNLLFYIHSSISTLNITLYVCLVIFICIYYFTKLRLFILLIQVIVNYGLILSFISWITGFFWGYFAWGTWILIDNKSYLIIFITIINFIIYFAIKYNYLVTNKFILFIIIISLPFWKILSSFWTTLHQSFSITLIGLSFPSNLLIYFYVIYFIFFISIIYSGIITLYYYLNKH